MAAVMACSAVHHSWYVYRCFLAGKASMVDFSTVSMSRLPNDQIAYNDCQSLDTLRL